MPQPTDGKWSEDAISALIELTRIFSRNFELKTALSAICNTALELTGGDHASLRLLNAKRTELVAGARSGSGENARKVTFRPGEGVVGWVAEQGRIARIGDVRKDPRFKVVARQGFAVQSLLVVPMASPEGVIGVLGISSSKLDAFDERAEMLAVLLANCAMAPIEKARLKRLAETDEHTRAFNRRFMMPRLESELERSTERGSPLSLVLVDVDRFKSVNDTYGHLVGDDVLRIIAKRIQTTIRDQDLLVRRGGDEFVIILPGADSSAATRVGERLRGAVSNAPIRSGELLIECSVSVGVAHWDRNETATQLEHRADLAMYGSKSSGRDRVTLAEPMATESTGTS